MNKFIIEKPFWEVFPEAKIGIVVLKGISNKVIQEDKYKALLSEAMKESEQYFTEAEFSQNKVIKVWREAFQKFKTKKGARSSIEALLKRANGGNPVGCINPLVDIYNSISLKYAMPCGGEDIDTFIGEVRLTKAVGDEHFITLGSSEEAPPYEGEIIYKDDGGAICRCWNWRESVRTMLTENTTNAFLCIELVDTSRIEEFEAALNELANLAHENLGGTFTISILDASNNALDF